MLYFHTGRKTPSPTGQGAASSTSHGVESEVSNVGASEEGTSL